MQTLRIAQLRPLVIGLARILQVQFQVQIPLLLGRPIQWTDSVQYLGVFGLGKFTDLLLQIIVSEVISGNETNFTSL